jgi:xanthosine utilization system XapX-like protein
MSRHAAMPPNPARNRTLKVVAGIAVSFIGLVATIIFLSEMQIISFEVAKLMLVALLGMYVGFGILIAIWRLIRKME